MKKKGMFVLPMLIGALCLSLAALPVMPAVYAAEESGEEGQNEENTQETETETETEFPESYFLPVESNEVAGWPQGPQIEAEAAVVMDADTGAFLYGKNMTAKEYPASITKLMTALVAIENGELDKKLKCSKFAVFSIESGSSHCGLQPGEKLTLRQALYALMLESANDAANSIAEKIGGSIDNFVEMMNAKAKELGCVNTHFTNAHGLHNKEHYTCAYDMALIAKAAFSNPTLAEIASTINYSIPVTNKVDEVRYFVNHHKMLSSDEFKYEGCVGGKTGFTSDALNTLVTVARRDDTELICVILRVNGAEKTYTETASLLDYGYKNFADEEEKVPDASTSLADLLNVKTNGRSNLLTPSVLNQGIVDVAKKVKVSLPKDADKSNLTVKYAADGILRYAYNGWEVGAARMTFKSPITDIPEPETVQTVYHVMDHDEGTAAQTEAENPPRGFLENVKYYAVQTGKNISYYWNFAVDWVYGNDAVMAIVVLILIIALLPVLVIAYVRNRSSQVIRKQRKKERDERVRREEEIESKSALEIEAEIRAELEREREKEQERKRKEEERKRQAELEEAKIAEAERVIEEMQNRREDKQEDTEINKGESEGEESV